MKRTKKRINRSKVRSKFNFNKLLLIAIPVFLIGGTIAKYINEKNMDIVYEASNFYFESDLLSDNTEPSVYTYNRGNTTISIKLMNNVDDLRYSEVDIEYLVSITDINGNKIEDKNGNQINSISGTLEKGSIKSDVITFDNLKTGNYLVTAKAISPYTKTIQGTFSITEKNEKINYQVNDSIGSPILQLTVLTEDYSGDVKITWPVNVVPDSTDENFENVNIGYNGGSEKVTFDANSEYTFQFFKKDLNSIYTNNDFVVERSK